MFKKILIAVIIAVTSTSVAYSCEREFNKELAINSLQKGGMIVFVRHAYAPKVEGINEDKSSKVCGKQRNLMSEGIKQSKAIGIFLREHNIKIEKAWSSPICRCWQTAEYAGIEFKKNKLFDSQTKEFDKIRDLIKSWNGKGNLFVFTHFKVMNGVFPGFKADSGQMLVVDTNLTRIGAISTPYDLMNKQ